VVYNTWVVFPSATVEKANSAVTAWRNRGYHTLVFQDLGSKACEADVVRMGQFPGYYRVINSLVLQAVAEEGADIVTCIGDDMLPDPYATAEDIAKSYFKIWPHGEGVLQATGDMQGVDESGVQAAARICGSPTFGRRWIYESYEGRGPFWSGYQNFYADEDLHDVAFSLGLLRNDPQITFLHQHWSWGWSDRAEYHKRNSDNTWEADAALYASRRAEKFPHSGFVK